MGGAVHLIRVN